MHRPLTHSMDLVTIPGGREVYPEASLEFSKRQFEDDNTMDDIGPISFKNDVRRPVSR